MHGILAGIITSGADARVPAYVMDAMLVPGTVSYRADPSSGRFDLALACNFQMRAPMSSDMQSSLTLAGSSPVPLISRSGGVDPGFFQDFTGSGSASTFSSGLALLDVPTFYQTSAAFGFQLGVPEPGSLTLLACGSLLTLGFAVGGRVRTRPAPPTSPAAPPPKSPPPPR